MNHLRIAIAWPIASLLALSACGDAIPSVSPDEVAANGAVAGPVRSAPSPSPVPTAATAPATTESGPRSCLAEIGAQAAARRVAVCRSVSPATRPPCNAANSCAMIDDEIARSCALFDGRGAPMKGCTPPPGSMAAAAAVVQRYYAAIDARDYATAWNQWGEDGRPGRSFAAFAAGFAHTRSTRVTIGRPVPGDGGAGSIYQPVPVTVDSTLDDGTRQRFRGRYVVRRANGVDGASAAQSRWHLDAAQLRSVAAD